MIVTLYAPDGRALCQVQMRLPLPVSFPWDGLTWAWDRALAGYVEVVAPAPPVTPPAPTPTPPVKAARVAVGQEFTALDCLRQQEAVAERLYRREATLGPEAVAPDVTDEAELRLWEVRERLAREQQGHADA